MKILVFLSCFSLFSTASSWESRLTLARTTVMGGLLVKKFPGNGSECVDLPVIWKEIYPRWSLDVEGKCVAVFKLSNCTGEPSRILLSRKPSFGEFLEKIPISSFRECVEGEEEAALNGPKRYKKLKLSRITLERTERAVGVKRRFQDADWNDPNVVFQMGKPAQSSVTFYSLSNFRGAAFTGRITDRCSALPSWGTPLTPFTVSSVLSPSECVRVYEKPNCQGRSVQVQAGDEYGTNLADLDFDKRVKSYGACEEFQKLGLLMHNYYRGLHGSPPLEMRESLNLAAQLMAEYLATQPALPKPIGFISAELFYATNDGPRDKRLLVRDAIQSWYKEGENYDPTNPVASRFTQLIWKNMKDFGIGTARVGNRAVVVANYFPRANFAGQFQENVQPRIY